MICTSLRTTAPIITRRDLGLDGIQRGLERTAHHPVAGVAQAILLLEAGLEQILAMVHRACRCCCSRVSGCQAVGWCLAQKAAMMALSSLLVLLRCLVA
jgi:hypothetical protein